MSKPVVLVTGADLAPQALELLAGFDVKFLGKTPSEEDVLRASELHQPVAIIVRYSVVSRRAMAASKNLRVVSKHGAGTDTIDKKGAEELGVHVRAAVGANADAVAEHTWALILATAKDLVNLDARMKAGYWDKATHKSLELRGKTLGVVGLGAIGRKVAQLGIAFGMKALAFDPYAKDAPSEIPLVPFEDVLAQAHVLSLNCPLTEDTRHLINRRTIARMRQGAVIVNTGRGGLIDDAAIIEALRSGKLRAAGLDAFTPEPLLGEHQFRHVSNIVLSPHVGGVTEDAYINMGTAAARNVLEVLRGVSSAA